MSGYKQNTKHEEQSEGYLVSVSDMMSGLLFIFIITLMVFVINFHIEKNRKKSETEKLTYIKEQLTDAKAVRTQLLVDLKNSLEEQGVKVIIDVEKGILHIPEHILFESGKAEFQKGGKESLKKLAINLSMRLPCYSGSRNDEDTGRCFSGLFKPGRLEAVLVEGHTDNVPIGKKNREIFKTNWDLSAKRSIVTFSYIIEVAPELKNLKNAEGESLFGVSGYADTRPVIKYEEIHPEPRNRRIDLRFILSSPKLADVNIDYSKD